MEKIIKKNIERDLKKWWEGRSMGPEEGRKGVKSDEEGREGELMGVGGWRRKDGKDIWFN